MRRFKIFNFDDVTDILNVNQDYIIKEILHNFQKEIFVYNRVVTNVDCSELDKFNSTRERTQAYLV